jgi:DNA replication protein DnaC
MENTNFNKTVCSVCAKPTEALEASLVRDIKNSNNQDRDSSYTYFLNIEDFRHDKHLACRVRLAKYSSVGIKSRWLLTEKFIVTNNNLNAYNYVEKVKKKAYEELRHSGVYFYGQPGTGKTHLLTNLCCGLIDNGYNYRKIIWANTSSLLTNIRSSFGKKYGYNEETEQEIVLKKLQTTILFLDDIGTESATDWAKEILYDVVNYRYEERLPTFISSNLSPQELANRLGDKFASRVIEMCNPIRVEGNDWRLKNADNREQKNNGEKIEIPIFSYDMASWENDSRYEKITKTV